MKEKLTYSVKLKIETPGYKRKFLTGISRAYSQQEALETAIKFTYRNLKAVNASWDTLELENITAISATKIKDNFIIDCDKLEETPKLT